MKIKKIIKIHLLLAVLIWGSALQANSNIDILFINFIEKVSQQNNINIYIDEDLKDKKVSIFIPEKISNKSLLHLFEKTVNKMDLNLKQSGKNYILSKKIKFKNNHYLYKLKYNSIKDCKGILSILGTKYSYLDDNNALLISATSNEYKKIKGFLDEVDKKEKQVILKIMIYEYQDTTQDERGVQYATLYENASGALETALNTIVAPFNSSKNTLSSTSFYGAVRFLHEERAIKIKQYPYVLAKNNKPFRFEAVENIPYLVNTTVTEASNTSEQTSIDYKDVGLKIKGLTFIYDDYITLDLDLIVEDLTNVGSDSNTPQTYKRHLNSNTNIEFDNVLVLSGIKRTKINKTKFEIPLLAQIPYLGEAFQFKYRSEEDINITIAIEVLRTKPKTSDEYISDMSL